MWVKDVKRIEDPGLVTGAVEFIDNLHLPNMAHCAMLRSPHPHARITSYDTSAAEALPGVVAVITGEDVEGLGQPGGHRPRRLGRLLLGRRQGSLRRRARGRGRGGKPIHRRRCARAGQRGVRAPAGGRYCARSDQRRRYQAVRRERKQRHPLQDVRLGRSRSGLCRRGSRGFGTVCLEPRRGQPDGDLRLRLYVGYAQPQPDDSRVLPDARFHGAWASVLAQPSDEQGQGDQPPARWQLWRKGRASRLGDLLAVVPQGGRPSGQVHRGPRRVSSGGRRAVLGPILRRFVGGEGGRHGHRLQGEAARRSGRRGRRVRDHLDRQAHRGLTPVAIVSRRPATT